MNETDEDSVIVIANDNFLIRQLVRKYYNCGWVFGKGIITVICDGEKFYIDLSKLTKKEIKEIKEFKLNGTD